MNNIYIHIDAYDEYGRIKNNIVDGPPVLVRSFKQALTQAPVAQAPLSWVAPAPTSTRLGKLPSFAPLEDQEKNVVQFETEDFSAWEKRMEQGYCGLHSG
ncbi:hypothetical protein QJS04_geneDACA024738 [Acorus gramineus]|uniref:Uncharacterized protein n=1 Tax=Acorus gramineus TaxID=55184 RepID=A0AAV9BPF3_ACOGR|nr:hypothetical protein QJS04_geneDACA024738 [Acorus gramineus]